jgi:hypothetical protein
VTYTRLRCLGGRLTVKLGSDANLFHGFVFATARVTTAKGISGGAAFDSHQTGEITLPLRARNGVCRVVYTVDPTAIPALVEKESTDTRVLGMHFLEFRYTAP